MAHRDHPHAPKNIPEISPCLKKLIQKSVLFQEAICRIHAEPAHHKLDHPNNTTTNHEGSKAKQKTKSTQPTSELPARQFKNELNLPLNQRDPILPF